MSAPSFKDLIQADVYSVFLNVDEFADVHTVDGKRMHVIFDKNELINRQPNAQYTEGLYIGDLLMYVPAREFGPRPKIGRQIVLDGKKQYRVIDCTDEEGVYSITLEAVRI